EAFAPVAPRLRLTDPFGDRLGAVGQRLPLRPKRRQHDPVAALARQLRQHASLEQARLAAAGGAQDQEQALATLDATRLQTLDALSALLVAAEKDRRILDIERMDPGVRRPAALPWKPARDLVADRADAAAQVVLSVGIPVPQIDALDLRRDLAIAERGKNHRENDLAERTRLRELHETPFRV